MAQQVLHLEGIPPDTTYEILERCLTDEKNALKEGLRIKFQEGSSTAKAIYFQYREHAQLLLNQGFLYLGGIKVTVRDGTLASTQTKSDSQQSQQQQAKTPPQTLGRTPICQPRGAQLPQTSPSPTKDIPSGTSCQQSEVSGSLRTPSPPTFSVGSECPQSPCELETDDTPSPSTSPCSYNLYQQQVTRRQISRQGYDYCETTGQSAINIVKPSAAIFYYTTLRGQARRNKLQNKHNVVIETKLGITECRLVKHDYTIFVVRGDISDCDCKAVIDTKSDSSYGNAQLFQIEIPPWNGGHKGEGSTLLDEVTKALHGCRRKKFCSVAVPVLGTERYGYPLYQAIGIVVKAVILACTGNPHMEIYLVDRDKWVVDVMRSVLEENFHCDRIETFASVSKEDYHMERDRVRVKDNTIFTLTGVKIELVKADIVKEKSDVIVNSIAKEMQRTGPVDREGALSKALMEHGGIQLIEARKKLNTEKGDIDVTESGDLQCKYVYHANCIKRSHKNYMQVLQQVIEKCLRKAHENRLESISFPALGTGKLSTPPKQSAEALYSTIVKFTKTSPNTTLKRIRIIIHKSNIYKEFQNEMNRMYNKNASKPQAPLTMVKKGKDKWIFKVTETDTPLKIKVMEGDITSTDIDVIVHATNEKVGLEGAVGKALERVGGHEFKSACKQVGKIQHLLAFSNGGQLKCREVLHVDVQSINYLNDNNLDNWKQVIMSCLLECESRKYNTVSFPLLGLGTQGITVYQLAEIYMQTFIEFALAGHEHISSVSIFAFGSDAIQGFQEGALMYLQDHGWFRHYITDPVKNLYKKGRGGKKDDIEPAEAITEDFSIKRTPIIYDVCRGVTLWLNGGSEAIKGAINDIQSEMFETNIPDAQTKHSAQAHYTNDVIMEEAIKLTVEIDKAQEQQYEQSTAQPNSPTVVARPQRKRIMIPDHATESQIEQLKIDHGIQMNPTYSDRSPHAVTGVSNDLFTQPTENRPKPSRIRKMIPSDDEDDYGSNSRESSVAHDWYHDNYSMTRSLSGGNHKKDIVENEESDVSISEPLIDYRGRCEQKSRICSRDNSEYGILTTGNIVIGTPDSNAGEDNRNYELSERADVTCDNTNAAISKGVRPKLQPDSSTSYKMTTGVTPKYTSPMSEVSLNNADGPDHQNSRYTRDVTPKVPRGGNERNTEVAPTTGIRPTPNQESSPLTKQGDNGLPITWSPMHDDDLVIDVPLDSSSQEYLNISSLFMKGTDNFFTITEIIRIQNPTFYLKVDLHRKFLEKKNKRGVTKMLWHGTKKELLETIKTNGFNRSYCGQNATFFGKGVYFARDVEYACRDTYSQPDPDGYKYVYYCKVLIGEFTQGTENMIDAPAKDPDVPHIKYDSVVNDMDDPKTHVIFSDTQAYPEYLVKFR